MLHIVSIPYALMKVNPLSWIQKVCQSKGTPPHRNLTAVTRFTFGLSLILRFELISVETP